MLQLLYTKNKRKRLKAQTLKMTIIIVTGTPSTGKTTAAKRISEELGFQYIDGKKVIKDNNLIEGYDEKRKCDIIDEDKFVEKLLDIIRAAKRKNHSLVIDSHMSHFLPKEEVDICLVTRCDLGELRKRLSEKRYEKGKVEENLQCEIMDVCLEEAREKGHNIIVVDPAKKIDIEGIKKLIRKS